MRARLDPAPRCPLHWVDPDLRGESTWSSHDPILSRNGASGKPGTVHTFVHPGTDTPTVIDGVDLALLTGTTLPWQGQVRVYDDQGVILDFWALDSGGFCREPPFYYDCYHYLRAGRIASVECFLRYVAVDDVVITEASTPVEGSTWGAIKATYGALYKCGTPHIRWQRSHES